MGRNRGDSPGGLIGLYGLLCNHCEAVEADLLLRGIDLRGLWTGALSWRRLKVIVDHLPPESATKTEIREALGEDALAELQEAVNGEVRHGPWSRLETLVAHVADCVNDLSYMTLSIAIGDKSKSPEPPARYPRPGVRAITTVKPSAAALAFLTREREERRHHLSLVQDGG